MPIPNPKYVSGLNELAQLCTDCAEAYRRAVQQVEPAQMAAFCKRRAEEREKLAGQLRARVDQLGEAPEEGGTLRGTVEKALGQARSLVGDDEGAILSELVRIEGALKERFEFFLEGEGPQEAEDTIREHYGAIADDFRELCGLVGSASE